MKKILNLNTDQVILISFGIVIGIIVILIIVLLIVLIISIILIKTNPKKKIENIKKEFSKIKNKIDKIELEISNLKKEKEKTIEFKKENTNDNTIFKKYYKVK